MFWLKMDGEEGLFGFAPIEDEEGLTQFVTDFPEKEWLHTRLQGKNYGTEVIFMGNSQMSWMLLKV